MRSCHLYEEYKYGGSISNLYHIGTVNNNSILLWFPHDLEARGALVEPERSEGSTGVLRASKSHGNHRYSV